tara:strand:- start:329 stop:889 length:561 start_codon:yes stop_codon:yes gene_type:complete
MNQNLIIYDFLVLYNILSEVKENLNFNLINISKKDFSNINFKDYKNYVLLSRNEILNVKNQININNFPVELTQLIEKINLEFLKNRFNQQSNILIGKYKMNMNSKEITLNNKNLKLTEKEINTILYIFEKKKSVNIKDLQSNVWKYQLELETHTVETHIHRLRKKIKDAFNDDNFIISSNNGYKIN